MKAIRKYLVAVALLAVLAVVFGLAGTGARVSPRQSLTSDSATHFTNPPTYDSGWVNITDKCGQDFTLVHNLNTTDITVDITGRTAILTEENWGQFWSMGDVNRDGYIDDTDQDLIMAALGSYPGHPNWNPDADLNQDLVVDGFDVAIFAWNYGLDIWTYFGAGTHQSHLGETDYTAGWSQTYGGADGDVCWSMVQTSDGGYALAGVWGYAPGSYTDSWLVKTDSCGNVQWNKTYGGTDDDEAWSMVQTEDGGYVLAGYTSMGSPNGYDFYLVRTDDMGNKLWENTFGGTLTDQAVSVVETSDGGYAIAGTTNFGFLNPDFWLIKTDSSGFVQWSQTYGGPTDDVCWSMVQTSDGGYALAGQTSSYGAGKWDFWLVKTNSIGAEQWSQAYGGAEHDVAYSLVQTNDGGYALAGYTESFGAGSADFWLVKTDSTGNHVWNKTYGGTSYEDASSLVQSVEGGYALAGRAYSFGAGESDFWLVKTDSCGNVQWNKTYGGTYADSPRSVVQTSDGGYALAGTTRSYGPGTDKANGWLVKTGVESGLAWTESTNNTITLYRGRTDPYWNFVRVRIWTIEEPTWQYGDIDMDGDVDYDDFIVLAGNYGKTYSALSLGGIAAIAGIYVYKKRKQPK